MKEIVDTNVFIRYLVVDNKKFFKQAFKWFKEAEAGKRILFVKAVVVAEICFVLESVYKKNRKEIASKVSGVLSPSWLEVEDKEIIGYAWKYYEKGGHFVDSYLLAWSKVHNGNILTFDKNLRKKQAKI